MSTFVKIFFPTTGIVLTVGGKLFLYYTEQMELKTAKLAELLQEKQDLTFKLSGTKQELFQRFSDTPVPHDEQHLKLYLALAVGVGLTLAFCYVPSWNAILYHIYGKIATSSGFKVKVAKLSGLDSDGNEIVAQLVGDTPGIMRIFFGADNREYLLGTLITACKTSSSNHSALVTEFATLKVTSDNTTEAFEKLICDYHVSQQKLESLNNVIHDLEVEIHRLNHLNFLDISPAAAVIEALSAIN